MIEKDIYRQRQQKALAYLAGQNISVAVIEDIEGRRSAALRYLCGLPNDGLLFLFAREKRVLLLAWDVALAGKLAYVDQIESYRDYFNRIDQAAPAILGQAGLRAKEKVELPESTTHETFLAIEKKLPALTLLCDSSHFFDWLRQSRSIKSPEETALYIEAAALTDSLLAKIEQNLLAGKQYSETEVALYLESEARQAGAEEMGFATLAAGSRRSWAIHAFPNFTNAAWADAGLSILDFGVKWRGYTTDVTLTVAREPLTKAQNNLLELVEKAYLLAVGMLAPGTPVAAIDAKIRQFFDEAEMNMPHSLGHGIGLEAHEAPALKNTPENKTVLQKNMIITIEPGLYDFERGGARLENDYLITDKGAKQLTNSRILRLPPVR